MGKWSDKERCWTSGRLNVQDCVIRSLKWERKVFWDEIEKMVATEKAALGKGRKTLKENICSSRGALVAF